MHELSRKALTGCAIFIVCCAILLFLPAGTLDFWQAWILLLVFALSIVWITVYFLKHDPKLIQRRLGAGPGAEKDPRQKRIQALASVFNVVLLLVAGFDRRFGWSSVPPLLVVMADLLVGAGFLITFFVFRENSFTSAIVEVAEHQQVISTGPYRLVRHPMYAAALLLFLATPLALGSYWALLAVPPLYFSIVWRLLEEEQFLLRRLPGYDRYVRTTRYRLIPRIW